MAVRTYVCAWCSSTFERERTRGPEPTYCSNQCRREKSTIKARADGRYYQWVRTSCERKRAKAAPREPVSRQCPYCAEMMGPRKRLQCGKDECRLAYHRERGDAVRSSRRAAARGAEADRFERREIFRRDRYVCHLCDYGIDPTTAYPHPGSATIDHVVPLARGGAHTWGNVRAAHMGCNSRKGARVA